MSILFVSLAQYGVVFTGDDMPYQVNRIIEVTINVKNGHWFTTLITHTFRQIGYPLSIFYPFIGVRIKIGQGKKRFEIGYN